MNVFAVESKAIPSLDDIKKLPNKVLLWCGKEEEYCLFTFQNSLLMFFLSLQGLEARISCDTSTKGSYQRFALFQSLVTW